MVGMLATALLCASITGLRPTTAFQLLPTSTVPALRLDANFGTRQARYGFGSAKRALCSAASGEAAAAATTWTPVTVYEELTVKTSIPGPPAQDITVEDLTPAVNALVQRSGLLEGTVTVVSRHTTTAITINEWESRLVDDIRTWLLKLAPPDDRSAVPTPQGGVSYFHNDIDKRPDSEDERQRCIDNGWEIANMDGPKGLAAWRAQEPINAHSHLLSMILGSSESIPVHRGKVVLGQWQSVMLVDLDGPRDRTVGLQVTGFK